MIRTNVVSLSVINAIAYRQKLPAGGSGIVIIREDSAQPGIASISKTSGEAIPAATTPKKLFPQEAFQEAIALTARLPYKKQGSVKLRGETAPIEAEPEKEAEEEAVVDSADYEKIVAKYTDKDGKLSYELLNRDMIKFLHSSSIARKMVEDGESVDAIRLYAVGSKIRGITDNHDLTDAQVLKIVELLDEVSPKGVFKEFNNEIRKSLKAAK
jgi:hypothetical protein